ncbi:MAG: hypothetical protein LQ337_006727 [Flavoplaca oasis]|nr:MAG: hypothetical protein LQ337_006727 [Flavoplaca oasis]
MAPRILTRQQHDIDGIRNHVMARVPSAAVPSLWLRISHVPPTTSGKFDVRTLSCLAKNLSAEGEMRKTHDDPQNDYERRIQECCARVLGVSASMTNNMLHHGLHSYAAMALMPDLSRALPNFQPSFREIMTNPDTRRLAALARS